jgi:hypothetical protein
MAPALVDERGVSLVGVRGPYTHSPLTRRPSGNTVSTCSTRVPDSGGPNVPMTLAMIRRDSQIPHARSGGISPLIGRNVNVLTAAAPRERSDPRAGTSSVMKRSQYQMVTLVNGSFAATSARRGNGSGTFQLPRDTSCGTAVPVVENAGHDAIAGARRCRVRSHGRRFCGVLPER